MIYYTGIGSRKTPVDVIGDMIALGKFYAERGYTLRSGGANGADSAFEIGCDHGKGLKEIYIPWKGFNGSASKFYDIPVEAAEIAKKYHPVWDKCTQGTKKLHSRNVCQVLGLDLNTPSNLLICWTPDGAEIGGTALAIKVAKAYGVQIINLGVSNCLRQVTD